MTTSKIIEGEIQQLEQATGPVTAQMDEKIRQFQAELPTAVAKWMKEEVRRRIEENAEMINQAGLDTVRQLKAGLDEVIAKLPTICAAAIGQPDTWPHRRKAKKSSAGYQESFFSATFRSSINPLGALLNQYNLVKPKQDGGSWERVQGLDFRYAINPGFEERNFPTLIEYNTLSKRHDANVKQVEFKQAELEKAKAKELWDQAQ